MTTKASAPTAIPAIWMFVRFLPPPSLLEPGLLVKGSLDPWSGLNCLIALSKRPSLMASEMADRKASRTLLSFSSSSSRVASARTLLQPLPPTFDGQATKDRGNSIAHTGEKENSGVLVETIHAR